MEAKTGKELLEVIHDDNVRQRINLFKGSDAKAVFTDNTVYIIGDAPYADFENGADFLKWRLKVLEFDNLMKELDYSKDDFANDVFDAMSEDWTEGYIDEVLTVCYDMEDLSNE